MVLANKEMLANSQHPDPDDAMITAGFSERMVDKGRRKKAKADITEASYDKNMSK